MSRRTILFLAICVATLASVAPPIAAYWLSRARIVEAEKQHLNEYARWTLLRTTATMNEAKQALRTINAEGYDGCSPAHVVRMRQLTIDNRSVDEIGYFEGGRLKCTNWGFADAVVPQGAPDRTTVDGFGLSFHVRPVEGDVEMLAVSYGSYKLLINSRRLADVLTDTPMTLGLATPQGDIVAMNGHASTALVNAVIRSRSTGEADDQLYSTAGTHDWIAFAISEQGSLQDELARERNLVRLERRSTSSSFSMRMAALGRVAD